LIVEAAIEVACRQYGLEGNEEFSQHIRESVAYRNNSADWESLLGELFDAERVEARQDVLTKALQMAGAYPADLPRLAIASLRRFDVHVSGLVASAEALLPRLVDAGYGEVAEVMRLRFLLSEVEADSTHRDAYIGDLLQLVTDCHTSH
jgi:hypothetical protein